MYKYFKKQNKSEVSSLMKSETTKKGESLISWSKHNKGFSLVEMLVAIGIFMVIMTIAIGSLISIIAANKKAQTIKSTIDSVNFAIENMSEDMRVGVDYQCSVNGKDFSPVNKDCSNGGIAVKFTNGSGHTVIYTFFGTSTDPVTNPSYGILTRKEGSNVPENLISQDSGINITSMTFYVMGADHEFPTPLTQPRVVITVSGLISVKGSVDTPFNLQTSVSQRARSRKQS